MKRVIVLFVIALLCAVPAIFAECTMCMGSAPVHPQQAQSCGSGQILVDGACVSVVG